MSVGLVLVGLLFISPFYVASEIEEESSSIRGRQKRSFLNLAGMVKAVTGRKGTDFMNYGHWCGVGGEGVPVDPVDECCQNHDICYDIAIKSVCSNFGPKENYLLDYKWHVADDETAVCDDEEDLEDKDARCKMTLCFCDAIITNCLKSNLEFYNLEHYHPQEISQIIEDVMSLP